MKVSEAQQLTLVLPPDSPYYAQVLGGDPGLAERLQMLMSDPQSFWNIPRSYALVGLALPQFPWPPAVIKAHRLCSGQELWDESLAVAYELQLPHLRLERDVIRALILCRDSTDETIAEVFGFMPEVIANFETLWWSVRERKDELLFKNQIMKGRHHSDFAHQLLRLALRSGKSSHVLLAADLPGCGKNEKTLMNDLEEMLLTSAVTGQLRNLLGKEENKALALLEKYLLWDAKPVEEQDVFTAMLMNPERQRIFKEIMRKQMEERAQALTKFAIAQAAASKNNSLNVASPPP